MRGDRARATALRARECSGGSASSSRLGGRHGFSLRKSLRPTPAAEENVCPVPQRLVHLGVAGHAPDAVVLQPDHRARFPQLGVEGEGVAQEAVGERVQRAYRRLPCRRHRVTPHVLHMMMHCRARPDQRPAGTAGAIAVALSPSRCTGSKAAAASGNNATMPNAAG